MKRRKVAIYARVSTEHEAQISALDNQVKYYENLLKLHPEWELYKMYIDEGITGTSIKKRKNFKLMIEDAENQLFDLIVTREVARFARNTVDTLQHTRRLRKYGVEVYFTEDNIWTMNDEDGELRLTIMATLAQNESKKTSIRVKAGQMISFQKGVLYGSGNILGYDRVGKEFVVNEEQAKTVRMIYDMYLEGMGMRKIQYALEKEGRLTATGLTNWNCANIGRILNNPFYSGTIVYRKEIVPDYLEQKKVKNYDYADKVVVEGKHQPIVTKEEFEQVQKILNSKSISVKNRGTRGVNTSNDVWCKKLKCSCGSTFNRREWRRVNGIPQHSYQCRKQMQTGTIRTRLNKGLSTEGICGVPMVPKWKLGVMADVIFQKFWKDRSGVLKIANEMLENHIMDDYNQDFWDEIQEIQNKIKVLDRKYDNLIDMRISGEISKSKFNEKKEEQEARREKLLTELSSYQDVINVSEEEVENKLKVLKYGLEQDFNFETHNIPDEVIDAFVKEIIVYEDYFIWKLNLSNDIVNMKVNGKKNNAEVSLVECPAFNDSSTGSYITKIGENHFGLLP